MRAGVAGLLVLSCAPAFAGGVSDKDALAIVQKHCVVCHAEKPAHESFQEAPNGIVLETVRSLRTNAAAIYAQTVQTKAMPLGNQSGMTDQERSTLGAWLTRNQ